MKKKWIVYICLVAFFGCQNQTEEESTIEEKKEIEKVETLKKTDKEKEDSVKAYWEKKMEKSKVGEEN